MNEEQAPVSGVTSFQSATAIDTGLPTQGHGHMSQHYGYPIENRLRISPVHWFGALGLGSMFWIAMIRVF